MNDAMQPHGFRVAAGIVSLVGPASAVMYETGHLRLFPADLMSNVWLVAFIGAVGAGIGIASFVRGARIVGAACLLSNGAVLALYGFIAMFFALGGSR